jgi:LysM repeat protein
VHLPLDPRLFQTLLVLALLVALAACAPEPSQALLPTLPAVLDITPAPTLDIDATATAYASLVLPSPTAAALYTVQSGDTLSGLADRFGTTVDELVAANGLTDPNALQPGQTLLIPSLLRTPVVDAAAPAAPLVTPSPTLSTP